MLKKFKYITTLKLYSSLAQPVYYCEFSDLPVVNPENEEINSQGTIFFQVQLETFQIRFQIL